MSERITRTTMPDSAPFVRVKVDSVVRRLWAIHAQLGDVPLAGLELRCEACGTAITSEGSRLVVDAVTALEGVIEDLIASGQRAA